MPKTKALLVDFDTIGKQYGKPDIERLGIFIENPYLNGKGYKSPFAQLTQFKGRNMLGEGRKSKCGTQHGYFEEEFKRLFEGEPWKIQKKKVGRAKVPFIPNGPGKLTATPGDYYGCFSGNIEAFSNIRRPQPKYKHPAANFMTNPVKQGGFGYADICLSKYPEYMPEPYKPKPKTKDKVPKEKKPPMVTCHYPQPYFHQNPFADPDGKIGPTYIRPREKRIPLKAIFVPTGPGKWQGGCHAGCFSPYPEWEAPKGKPPRKVPRRGVFYAQSMALKTMNTVSIVQAYTDHRVNHKNSSHYEPNYTKYLLN